MADWAVRYREDGKLFGYKITVLRDDLVDVRVTQPKEVDGALGTGVEVRITELDRSYRSLDPQYAVQSLSEVFALYLTDYSDVGIFVEGERLDPSKLIASRERWSFWVLSNDLDSYASIQTRQKGKARGQVFQSEDGGIEVWVKTWAEVIAECKSRMKFVQEHLQANVDRESSLKYLKKT